MSDELSLDSDIAALKASILSRPHSEPANAAKTSTPAANTPAKEDGGTAIGDAAISAPAAQAAAPAEANGEHLPASLEDEYKRKERMLREKMRSEFGKIHSKQQQLEEVRR
jgi:hypothetical protein